MIIEISDLNAHHVLLPTLKDLLFLLPEYRQKLVWSILEAEVIRKDEGTIIVSELEDKVYSWAELIHIANDFFQEINITVVGCTDEKLIPRLGIDEDYYAPCEIVIEGIDTSLWSVYAKQDSDLSEMRKTYQKVKIVKD